MNKVLIFGSFDILHPGHLFLIEEARKYGELHAVVALDETIQKVKWEGPKNSLAVRMKNLQEFNVQVHAGDPVDRLRVFREVAPDVVVLGYDQIVFVDQLKDYINSNHLKTKIITALGYRSDIFKSRKIRAMQEDPDAGFIVTNKPSGEPSFRTVSTLRKITGIRQIGFAGTLDPLASGVLVVGIGAATKLLDWWHFLPKVYEAEAKLGIVSDTYDSEGVIQQYNDRTPSVEEIREKLETMIGLIDQVPPMYSAKKLQGKPLYKLARLGETIERKAVPVLIQDISINKYFYPYLRFSITCGSGTYIRSLVHDLGASLGTGAIMTELVRSAIGQYTVADAVSVSELTNENYRSHFIDFDALRTVILKQGMFDFTAKA